MPVPIDVALVNYMRSKDTIMALVSGRIFPALAPTQAPLPYIVYSQSDYRSERHMLGVSVLKWATFTWEAYGTPRDKAREIRDAMVEALDGLRGGFSGVAISQVWLRGVGDELVDDQSGGQQMIYNCHVQFEVAYFDPTLVDP